MTPKEFPCFKCKHPEAWKARKEVIDVVLALMHGDTPSAPRMNGGDLPDDPVVMVGRVRRKAVGALRNDRVCRTTPRSWRAPGASRGHSQETKEIINER
jgi:hypothetical protein